MLHKLLTIVCVFCILALASDALMARSCAEGYSGQETSHDTDRQMLAFGDDGLLVINRWFFLRTHSDLYLIRGDRSEKLASFAGIESWAVQADESSCIIENREYDSIAHSWGYQEYCRIAYDGKKKDQLLYFSPDDRHEGLRHQYYYFQGELCCWNADRFQRQSNFQGGAGSDEVIFSSVERVKQFDTAIMLHDGVTTYLFDGKEVFALPKMEFPYYRNNILKLDSGVYFTSFKGQLYDSLSQQFQLYYYDLTPNNRNDIILISPNTECALYSSIYYRDGFIYGIWGDSLYAYHVESGEWELLIEFPANEYELDQSEIAVCKSTLYLILRSKKTSTRATLYSCDLAGVSEQTDVQIKRIMNIRKTSFWE